MKKKLIKKLFCHWWIQVPLYYVFRYQPLLKIPKGLRKKRAGKLCPFYGSPRNFRYISIIQVYVVGNQIYIYPRYICKKFLHTSRPLTLQVREAAGLDLKHIKNRQMSIGRFDIIEHAKKNYLTLILTNSLTSRGKY